MQIKYSFWNKKTIISTIILLYFFITPIIVKAVGMNSASYEIEFDSINFGGTEDSASASYKLRDTMGEIGTGPSSSAAYNINAGYRQAFGEQWKLSFFIRDKDDLNLTLLGPLGTLNPSSVATCSYRLKIGCTYPSGFQAHIYADDELNIDATPSLDIDNMTEDQSPPSGPEVTAGYEQNGIRFAPPTDAGTGGTATAWPEQDPFDDDDTPIPVGSTAMDTFLTSNGTQIVDPNETGDTDGTTLVTHRAAINVNTPSGDYTQEVTYVITTNL